jgi:hypothetical protein
MKRIAILVVGAACSVTACWQCIAKEKPMNDGPLKTHLYRIVHKEPDGECIRATLKPVRVHGETVEARFCHADDVEFLKDGSPRHWMTTLLDEHGSESRLWPVTIGLDVSIAKTSPSGEATLFALPRPSPLHLPAAFAGLRGVIDKAVREGRPIAFALSDSRTIIDAAPIDRETAYEMLGMRP